MQESESGHVHVPPVASPRGARGTAGALDHIFAEQVRLLYDQGFAAMLAAPVAAVLLAGMLWPVAPHGHILLWLTLVVTVTILRVRQVRQYRQAAPSPAQAKAWARRYVFGCFVAGGYWGAAVPLMYPPGQPFYQYLLILTICLLLVSMMFSFSALKSAFFAVTLPTIIPLITVLALQESRGERLMAVGIGVFGIVVSAYMLRIHRLLRRSLELRFENTELIADLEASRRQSDALNEQLVQSGSLLESTLEASASAIASVDAGGRLAAWNGKFLAMWALGEEQARAIQPAALLRHLGHHAGGGRRRLVDAFRRVRESRKPVQVALETRDGRSFEVHAEPRQASGHAAGQVWSFHDVTARRQAEARLSHMAHHDPLTGLPNRSLLYDRLQQATRRARRRDGLCAVLYLDLDGFKAVNDGYGHATGDRLLLASAERLRDCLRSSDTVARMGGDEFVVIVEDLKRPADVCPTADKILEALGVPFPVNDGTHRLGASIGIAVYPQHTGEPDELLSRADMAMYAAKRDAGNVYRLYSPELDARV